MMVFKYNFYGKAACDELWLIMWLITAVMIGGCQCITMVQNRFQVFKRLVF